MDVLYKVIGGSHSYGLSVPESDLDYRGVFFPDWKKLLGFGALDKVAESKANGDDSSLLALQQFGRLISKNNYVCMEILFTKPEYVIELSPYFKPFIDQRDQFLSKNTLVPLCGFAQSNLSHLYVRPSTPGNRQDLFDKTGYNSKYLTHTLRVLMVGEKLIDTGIFDSDMTEHRDYLLGIRYGTVPKEEALQKAIELKDKLTIEISSQDYARQTDLAQDLVVEISKAILREKL